MAKWAKLKNQPIAFLRDSRWGIMRFLGRLALWVQRLRLRHSGRLAAGAHVTIIMTAYKTADFIGDAVRSVLLQTHQNFTLIIVDDCCPENSGAIALAAAAGDARVLVYRASQNNGTYWAKNWAMARTSSPFICFHDSDDISHPDRLALQLGALASAPDAVAAVLQWRRQRPDGERLYVDGKAHMLSFITTMIRREPVLTAIGYFDQVRKAADQNFHQRLMCAFGKARVLRLPHVAYVGVMRADALTADTYDLSSGADHVARIPSQARADYAATSADWISTAHGPADLYLPHPLTVRPFAAPSTFVLDAEKAADTSITALHGHTAGSAFFEEAL